MRQTTNRLFALVALIAMSLSAIAQSQANSNARSLIMNAGNSYMKGEYTECANMLKDVVPSLSDAYEILTGYNLYLMASLRCDTLLAEAALEQCANSVKEKLLPDIYQNQTEYDRQLVWRITALSLHQHAMSIALGSKSDTTKKLAYRLVQVAKNLEVEADQYARTVMAKNSMTNAILINRYDRQKDSLYFSYGNMAADSLAFKIEMNKWLINKQIPISEVFDNVSDYEQIRRSLPVNATMVEYCIYRAISGEDRYGAFIFDNNSDSPMAVDVCSATDVDQLITKEKNSINELYHSESLCNTILAGILPHIKSAQLVICPVGRLEHFNFSAFNINGKRMMDTYQVSRATNGHRYAAEKQRTNQKIESAILYGGIAYSEDQAKHAKAAAKHFHFMGDDRSARGSLRYLQYSNYEVAAIRDIMKKNRIPCKLLSGKAATTGSFKNISTPSPSIIHIATHGFTPIVTDNNDKNAFNGLDIYEEAKLLNSGLYFAFPPKHKQRVYDLNDGILTAYEISHMNLTGTQLVVLSACDTADGLTNNIEGLYGLQYALRRAGAGAMLLNLWKVSDAISYLFMREFYRSLFDCHDIDQAYAEAIDMVKKQHSDPYSWAGFVLIHN